jgi:hypothetical protein
MRCSLYIEAKQNISYCLKEFRLLPPTEPILSGQLWYFRALSTSPFNLPGHQRRWWTHIRNHNLYERWPILDYSYISLTVKAKICGAGPQVIGGSCLANHFSHMSKMSLLATVTSPNQNSNLSFEFFTFSPYIPTTSAHSSYVFCCKLYIFWIL